MAVQAMGTQIRIPQGDTGHVRFVADAALDESDRALFTVARPGGGMILRKVLVPDMDENAFYLPFVYEETAGMKPDRYDWSLRVVRGGMLDDRGRIASAVNSQTAILRGRLIILPVAGGAR